MAFGNCYICGEPNGNSVTSSEEGFAHDPCWQAREDAKPLQQRYDELIELYRRVQRLVGTLSECPVCEWPMPPDNDYWICACCGFQVRVDSVETYKWDGKWWANDKLDKPRILRDGEQG